MRKVLLLIASILSACATSTKPSPFSVGGGLGPAPYRMDESRIPAAPSQYKITGTCGGFPRVDVQTAPGFCLGQVDSGEGLIFPRSILEVAPGRFLIADMGGRAMNNGRLW
jgi:hypothetical protein